MRAPHALASLILVAEVPAGVARNKRDAFRDSRLSSLHATEGLRLGGIGKLAAILQPGANLLGRRRPGHIRVGMGSRRPVALRWTT